jgi:hypothetical protein
MLVFHMKLKIVCILAVAFFLADNAGAQMRSSRDLLGVWEGNQLRVEFQDNSKVSVLFTNEPKQDGSYKADFFRKPVQLEISGTNKGQHIVIRCIIEFIDSNTLRWEAFDKGDFPDAFSNSALVLKKKR